MILRNKLFKYYQEELQTRFPHLNSNSIDLAAQESARKEIELYDEEADFNRIWELLLQSAGSSIRDTLQRVS